MFEVLRRYFFEFWQRTLFKERVEGRELHGEVKVAELVLKTPNSPVDHPDPAPKKFQSFDELANHLSDGANTVPAPSKFSSIKKPVRSPFLRIAPGGSTKPAKVVDLHGFGQTKAVEATMDALDRAINAGCDQVVVIHGKGLGRVKKAVLSALDDCAAVKSYRPEQDNPGRTRVFL